MQTLCEREPDTTRATEIDEYAYGQYVTQQTIRHLFAVSFQQWIGGQR